MPTLIVTHKAALEHQMGVGHPERPARLTAIYERLSDDSFNNLTWAEAPFATHQDALRVHPESHLQFLEGRAPSRGLAYIDSDTLLGPNSLAAIWRAVGGTTAAVDAVMRKEADNAFVLMRPPGHHAERTRSMGFCFINNIAVAARYAQATYGVERVAIIDFDVHHGNGTQDIFWSDQSVLYASTHQSPLFPGTGDADETGEFNTIVNAPLPAGDKGALFRSAYEKLIFPRVRAHHPDLILISAGFDAHRLDPLGGLLLNENDFFWITQRLVEIATECAQGRVVSVLEGGYDLEGLSLSASAHVRALMGGDEKVSTLRSD